MLQFIQTWLPAVMIVVLFLAICASVWAVFGRTHPTKTQPHRVRSQALLPPISAPAPVPPLPSPPTAEWARTTMAPAGVATRDWLQRINHQPDRTPHLAVTGPSGSGKTTFVLAVLADRPGQLVICTPKAARTDPWGGFPAVRLNTTDMSYAPLGNAVRAVYQEMLRRNAQNAQTDGDWLTLVVDDYSTVVGELPDIKPIILRMLTLGRSVRIRLVIIDTETNVKAWGIEGRGEARHNLVYVELEEDTHAARMFRWKERDKPHALDVSAVPMVSTRAHLAGRAWQPVSNVSDELAPFARVLTTDTHEADRTGTALFDMPDWPNLGGTPNQYDGGTADTDAPEPGTDEFLIYELVRRGKSANAIFDLLGGTRASVLDKVRKYKEILDTEQVK